VIIFIFPYCNYFYLFFQEHRVKEYKAEIKYLKENKDQAEKVSKIQDKDAVIEYSSNSKTLYCFWLGSDVLFVHLVCIILLYFYLIKQSLHCIYLSALIKH
jgi:hypothetical protein